MKYFQALILILTVFFIEKINAQELPLLTAIRGNYFILNHDSDSLFVSGLKNSNSQMIYFLFAAEEDPIGLDPGLSNDGRWRSINLLNIFRDYDLAAYFSTPFRRNVLTLQPLSEYTKIPVSYYDQADLKSLYDKLNKLKSSDVIIMAHKESLPKIIEHFTQKGFTENITDQVYDRIFVLERSLSGLSTVRVFKYDIR
ncbi:MAG: hypothetical protein ABI851_06635 [Saprospiraceae bacterium]